jgi:hypothetical protein
MSLMRPQASDFFLEFQSPILAQPLHQHPLYPASHTQSTSQMLRILMNSKLATPTPSLFDISASLDPSLFTVSTVGADLPADFLCPKLSASFYVANDSTDLLTLSPRVQRSLDSGSNVHLLFDTGGESLRSFVKYEVEMQTMLQMGGEHHGLAFIPVQTNEQVIARS